MSGTGASLFATPIFLELGVGLPAILASNQICAALWTPIAARTYRIAEPLDKKLLVVLSFVGAIGVWFGYKTATLLRPDQCKSIIGAVILSVVAIVWSRPMPKNDCAKLGMKRGVLYIFAFFLGVYQAFFGAGNSLFSSLVLKKAAGFDFKRALAHEYALAFVWCSLSAFFYWRAGWMDWGLVLPAAIGSTIGATVGSRFGRALSNVALRRLFLVAGGVMGMKLLILG